MSVAGQTADLSNDPGVHSKVPTCCRWRGPASSSSTELAGSTARRSSIRVIDSLVALALPFYFAASKHNAAVFRSSGKLAQIEFTDLADQDIPLAKNIHHRSAPWTKLVVVMHGISSWSNTVIYTFSTPAIARRRSWCHLWNALTKYGTGRFPTLCRGRSGPATSRRTHPIGT